MNFGSENLMVSENLRDFRGTGSMLGFSVLEQLTYDRPAALAARANADAARPDDEARALLARIKLALGVKAPTDLGGHLNAMERRFANWQEAGVPQETSSSPPTQEGFLAHLASMRQAEARGTLMTPPV